MRQKKSLQLLVNKRDFKNQFDLKCVDFYDLNVSNKAAKKMSEVRVKGCLICEKHANLPVKPIYESDSFIVIHYLPDAVGGTMYKGHVFVEPKRHVKTTAELTDAESVELGRLLVKSAKAIYETTHPEHIYNLSLGHQVEHLHFHVVPRYEGTPKEHWGPLQVHDWKNAPRLKLSEIESLSIAMSEVFKQLT